MSNRSFQDIRLDVTTNGSGDGSATASTPVKGYLLAIEFFDGTLADAHTAVLSVTGTPSGADHIVWSTTAGDTNSDAYVQPLAATVDSANDAVAATYGPNYIKPYICGKPKLVIAAGGASASGGCILHLEV